MKHVFVQESYRESFLEHKRVQTISSVHFTSEWLSGDFYRKKVRCLDIRDMSGNNIGLEDSEIIYPQKIQKILINNYFY